MLKKLIAGAVVLGLGACAATPGYGPAGTNSGASVGDACGDLGWGKVGGAVLGAGLGGLAGNQIGRGSGNAIATGLGVVLGGLAGGAAGSRLDTADCLKAQQARQVALAPSTPVGQTISWSNPANNSYGSFTPMRDGTNNQTGRLCREYQQSIVIGGETKQGVGTACQQPDGSWQIVSQQ